LSRKIKDEGDGWICSRGKKETLWKNAEIRADWQNVANELGNQEEVSWCWPFYGGMMSWDVLQEICTFTSQN